MDKLAKKVEHNKQVLELWHESIAKYNALNSKEIKKLMKSYLQETDENKKVEIRNRIVLGTLEYLYQFLKQSIFINIICNWFDMEDVIQSSIEVWVKRLKTISKDVPYARPFHYRIDSGYILYGETFINNILISLCSNDKIVYNNLFLAKDLAAYYYIYLKNRKNNSSFTFNDFKTLMQNDVKGNFDDTYLIGLYQAFKYLDKAIIIDSDEFDEIDSLKYLLCICLNMGDFTNINGWEEDIVLKRMLEVEVIKQLFKDDKIDDSRKKLLYKIFYLNESIIEIAKEKNISRIGVNALKNRTFTRIKEKYQYLVEDWY